MEKELTISELYDYVNTLQQENTKALNSINIGLRTLTDDLKDDGKLNAGIKPKDTLVTNFRFFTWNTVYKLAMIAILAYSAYHLIPVVAGAISGRAAPPAVQVIQIEEKAASLFDSAVDIVQTDIDSNALSTPKEAVEALSSNLPSAMQEPICTSPECQGFVNQSGINQFEPAMKQLRSRFRIIRR
jgi:hypothetical protein